MGLFGGFWDDLGAISASKTSLIVFYVLSPLSNQQGSLGETDFKTGWKCQLATVNPANHNLANVSVLLAEAGYSSFHVFL